MFGDSAGLGDGGAQKDDVTHLLLSPTIAEIIQLHRMRQRWIHANTKLVLAGKGLCRGHVENGDKAKGAALFTKIKKGGSADPLLEIALMPFLKGIENFEPDIKQISKQLERLVQTLPVWPWVQSVKGFGAGNFAAIVGEAGDIGSYRNPSCVWKRLGLAVIEGGRQRKVADVEGALLHGYNPRRRAIAFVLGETLLKGNDGPYRAEYERRRAHTAETHPDWSKLHSHRDGMRIMTKRLLRDLFEQWTKKP